MSGRNMSVFQSSGTYQEADARDLRWDGVFRRDTDSVLLVKQAFLLTLNPMAKSYSRDCSARKHFVGYPEPVRSP